MEFKNRENPTVGRKETKISNTHGYRLRCVRVTWGTATRFGTAVVPMAVACFLIYRAICTPHKRRVEV